MLVDIFKQKVTYVILFVYLVFASWWAFNFLQGFQNSFPNYLYGAAYALIAFFGAFYGIKISLEWGGWKSTVGRGILFLSLGLLGMGFGQTVWSYYNLFTDIEVPFPSLADYGYFSVIPFYALGIYNLGKAAGVKYRLGNLLNKLAIVLIPLIMLTISYFLFLKNIAIDTSSFITNFLNFGTPLGDAIYISLALLTYQLTRGVLGGIMRGRILFIVGILIFQYLTDYTFLYRAGVETYYNGDIVDLLFTTAFILMTLGLISFKREEKSNG